MRQGAYLRLGNLRQKIAVAAGELKKAAVHALTIVRHLIGHSLDFALIIETPMCASRFFDFTGGDLGMYVQGRQAPTD